MKKAPVIIGTLLIIVSLLAPALFLLSAPLSLGILTFFTAGMDWMCCFLSAFILFSAGLFVMLLGIKAKED